jgi:hypothetical protein
MVTFFFPRAVIVPVLVLAGTEMCVNAQPYDQAAHTLKLKNRFGLRRPRWFSRAAPHSPLADINLQ